jgi:hypothetical protein
MINVRDTKTRNIIKDHSMLANILRRPGGLSEEPEPDPIPNSAVKLLSADGTVSQDPGE